MTFFVSLIKDYNSITKSRLSKLSTLTYLFVLYHFTVKNDTKFCVYLWSSFAVNSGQKHEKCFCSPSSTFLCCLLPFSQELLWCLRKIDGFKHFFLVHPKKRRKKQVVDIPVPSFRDHLSLTLIYFGTANKVQKEKKGMFALFFLAFSLAHPRSTLDTS